MEYNKILFDKRGRVASITLNNPSAYNPYGKELALELYDAAKVIKWDNDIRVVTIQSIGKSFSAGGDVRQFKEGLDGNCLTEMVEEIVLYLNAYVLLVKKMDKIFISYIDGICAGVGLSLALNVDISIATERSVFIGGYNGLGVNPDGGSGYSIFKNAGIPRANWFFLSNEPLNATEAYNWGIISRVVKEDQGKEYLNNLALKIADGPHSANIFTKQLFYKGENLSFEEYIEMEKDGIILSTKSKDMKEGVTAFIEKRRAVFK